jgi:hypothetical protein
MQAFIDSRSFFCSPSFRLGSFADIRGASRFVRFVPYADIRAGKLFLVVADTTNLVTDLCVE